jgi:hypothetical protein
MRWRTSGLILEFFTQSWSGYNPSPRMVLTGVAMEKTTNGFAVTNHFEGKDPVVSRIYDHLLKKEAYALSG